MKPVDFISGFSIKVANGFMQQKLGIKLAEC